MTLRPNKRILKLSFNDIQNALKFFLFKGKTENEYIIIIDDKRGCQMEDFYENETTPSGYPEGFEGEINNSSMNVMPTNAPNNSNFNFNFKIIGLCVGIVLLLITIVLVLIMLIKPKEKTDGDGYRVVVEHFMEALEKEEPELFDPYIYDESMDGYMEKVVKSFKGSEINNMTCEYDDEAKSGEVQISFNKKDGLYKTSALIETRRVKGKWYLYSCKFDDFELVEKFEEATPADAVEERVLVNVGTDVSGHFDVPDTFTLSTLNLANTDNIAYEYTLSGTYQDKTESISVIVYLETQPISDMAAALSTNLFGEAGEIVLESDKDGEVYREARSQDGIVTEARTFLGADGRARSYIAKYVEGDEVLRGLWTSYTLPSGIIVEPTPTDATQVIGSETMGTMEIPGGFTVNEDYSAEGLESVGYVLDDKVVVLMNYAGSDKESIPTAEFAKSVRDSFLGENGSEFDVKEEFPNAYYSSGVGEDGVMSEMYAFTGGDDINRLILLIHNQDDADTAELYRTYNLGVGIKELE